MRKVSFYLSHLIYSDRKIKMWVSRIIIRIQLLRINLLNCRRYNDTFEALRSKADIDTIGLSQIGFRKSRSHCCGCACNRAQNHVRVHILHEYTQDFARLLSNSERCILSSGLVV